MTSSNQGALEPAETRPGRQRFRPDIQALRAVAVASVVFYHFWPEVLPGGFVGVDIFFVISGYLITAHLFGEVSTTGGIALLDFWARRIRRLLPAALTVLGASTLALFLLMPSVTWQDSLQELGASAAYVQNWLLAFRAVDYLGSEGTATLAQHYWSLSVEEQFYVVWPIVLLAALALSRRSGRVSTRFAMMSALGVIFVVSLGASLTLTATQQPFAFFATPARAWEFAAGGLLALILARRPVSGRTRVRTVAAWLGVAVIAGSVFLIDGSMAFPGWIALFPVLGAVLCIAGGDTVRTGVSRVLVHNPVTQWVGDHSYSIYLWHWPLLIIAPWALREDLTWGSKTMLVALTLVLAYLLRKFVEDPVRSGAFWRKRRWPAFSLAAGGMAVILATSMIASAQIDLRNASEDAAAFDKVLSGEPCFGAAAMVPANGCTDVFSRPAALDTAFAAADVYPPAAGCQQARKVIVPVVCTFGDISSPSKTIAVVGNSHAVRLMPALDLYGLANGWKILLMASTDCMGLTTRPVGDQNNDDACLGWSRNVQRDLLDRPDLDAVVFASHVSSDIYLAGVDPTAADRQNASEQVVGSWSRFVSQGVTVIVTGDVPGMRPYAAPECIARSAEVDAPCSLERSSVDRPNLMSTLADQRPDLVSYVPLTQLFCDESRCYALIGGVVVYSDSHHLTTTYSRTLAGYLGSSIAAALQS